ncbi:MAG: glycosyltransferase family 2 protein [Kiritimatiellae bacterium]|nr:glycosyltransferase family 2 protein [Kiritimatiellia bacterium]
MKIAVLMTCYNRAETTLRALGGLAAAADGIEHDVFLVDDASPDGTGLKAREHFPNVHVINGTGRLYWAKGMRLAWEAATKSGEYDFYLWLNDDVALKSDAIANILADYALLTTNNQRLPANGTLVLIGACFEDIIETKCSYGAKNHRDELIVPNGTPQLADGWFNGNFVLVPKAVYEKVGMISGDYSHARADYDYAERLKAANIPFYCSSKYIGVCHNDFGEKMRGKSLRQRIKLLWQPGYWNLHDLWLIRYRYHGIAAAILSCAHLVSIVVKGVK